MSFSERGAYIKKLTGAVEENAEVFEEIGKFASAAVVGNGMDDGVQFGPIQNRMQFDKVCSYIDNAKANGRIIAGGDVSDAPGFVVPLRVVRYI